MRYLIIVTTLLVFLSCDHLCAQSSSEKLAEFSASVMQHRLSLSEKSTARLVVIEKNRLKQIDSLSKISSFSIDQRKQALRNIQQLYNAQLKNLFTPGEWSLYQKMEAEQRNSLIQKTRDKKIPIKELEVNN